MAQAIGRFKFTDTPNSRIRICDNENEFERKLLGVEDDEEEIGIIQRLAGQCEGLSREQKATLITILQADQEPPRAIDGVIAANNRRWGIKDKSLAGNYSASQIAQMTPTQRFIAASNLRHGIGR